MSAPPPINAPYHPQPSERLGCGWYLGSVIIGFLLGLQGRSITFYDSPFRDGFQEQATMLCALIGVVGGPIICVSLTRLLQLGLPISWRLLWFLVGPVTSLSLVGLLALVTLTIPYPVKFRYGDGGSTTSYRLFFEQGMSLGLGVGFCAVLISVFTHLVVRLTTPADRC